MFKPFAVDGRVLKTRPDWTSFVRSTPKGQQLTLMNGLRRLRGSRFPNFSRTGTGQSLAAWARKMKAGYTLRLEIARPQPFSPMSLS
jgi:hypothetical protein